MGFNLKIFVLFGVMLTVVEVDGDMSSNSRRINEGYAKIKAGVLNRKKSLDNEDLSKEFQVLDKFYNKIKENDEYRDNNMIRVRREDILSIEKCCKVIKKHIETEMGALGVLCPDDDHRECCKEFAEELNKQKVADNVICRSKNVTVEPCDSKPCLNGGTCKVVNESYNCACVNHYSGKNCEVPPPCEAEKPCINGVCEDISAADYRCKCNAGWTGKNCDERPCDKHPCVNTRKCINNGTGYECVCLEGWEGANCKKDGSAGGDPHYKTFDGKRYDFMGKCEYILAKDCSIERAFVVLQQNEACGSGTVSCTKSIKVHFQSMEVIMQRNGLVYIDGILVSLPWKKSDSDTQITTWASGAVLDVPDLLFSVRWDGVMGVHVYINQRYKGNMCGLLGNADNNPNNDFRLPDQTVTTNITKFGNAWKTNPRCVNGIVPPDPCKNLSAEDYRAIKDACGKMTQPPFRQCNGKITPDIGYIPNCEYDLCAMKGNPTAAWCQALEKYDKACGLKGVNIDWEGEPGFAECGKPCANMPCFNGAKCENINGIEFNCSCPKGFSGPTCENVGCKPGYISRGNLCYKKMSRRPWVATECPSGEDFALARNGDENKFLYEKFVKPSRKSFWMNARVCGEKKLCDQSYGRAFYHNFADKFPSSGCVEMPYGKNGTWIGNDCEKASYYVCIYDMF